MSIEQHKPLITPLDRAVLRSAFDLIAAGVPVADVTKALNAMDVRHFTISYARFSKARCGCGEEKPAVITQQAYVDAIERLSREPSHRALQVFAELQEQAKRVIPDLRKEHTEQHHRSVRAKHAWAKRRQRQEG